MAHEGHCISRNAALTKGKLIPDASMHGQQIPGITVRAREPKLDKHVLSQLDMTRDKDAPIVPTEPCFLGQNFKLEPEPSALGVPAKAAKASARVSGNLPSGTGLMCGLHRWPQLRLRGVESVGVWRTGRS